MGEAPAAMIVAVPVKARASEFQFDTPQPLYRYHASARGNSLYDVVCEYEESVVTDHKLSLAAGTNPRSKKKK